LPYFSKQGEKPTKGNRVLTIILSTIKITIRFSVSENPTVEVSSFYLQKCEIVYFIARRQVMDECLFVVVFSMADRIGSVVLKCHERAHSNGNQKF